LATCGRIDALVLNAATIHFGRVDSPNSTVDGWKQLFDVNLFSLLHTVRASLPQLRASKGKIIFVSSGAAVGNTAAWGAYNASKAAMNSFCRYTTDFFILCDLTRFFDRTLASEEPNITCVALRPGAVDTSVSVNQVS
jgi:NAD(P)-dependent dehydrogenase (short-subunit alcohol dehydrogenase family)